MNHPLVYEVLFFDGWGAMPVYYLLDNVEGNTPEQALAASVERITQQIRRRFGLHEGEVSDGKFKRQSMCCVRMGWFRCETLQDSMEAEASGI